MSLAEREPSAIDASDRELPEGWAEVALDRVLVSLESGSRPSGGVRGIVEGIPSIGGEHLNDDGGFRFENVKYVPEAFFNRMSRGHIQQGDVLIVKDGATTGKVSYVDSDFPYSSAVVNEHVFICRVAPDVDSRFVFRFLHSEEGQRRILENFRGSAQGGINQNFAPNTAIPLPPLTEQRRIVAKVEQLLAVANASRERLARVPTLLKRFRQAVLAAVCSGRLTADWREQHLDEEPAAQLLERILAERRAKWEAAQAGKRGRFSGKAGAHFVDIEGVTSSEGDPRTFNAVVPGFDGSVVEQLFRKQQVPGQAKYQEPAVPDTSELPKLPESWCWASLGQCFKICVGSTPSRKVAAYWGGDIAWVSSGEVQFCRIRETREHITEEGLANSSTQMNPVGSVLLGMIGEGKTRGQAAILDIAACNNQNCAAIWVSETPIPSDFVYYWLWSQYEENRQAGAGNSQHALNKQRVAEIALPLPPLAEQYEIVRQVAALFKFADAVERRTAAASSRADRLTQAILAKAFRGGLVPTEAELARSEGRDYEPASALLERIQVPPEKAGLPASELRRNGTTLAQKQG